MPNESQICRASDALQPICALALWPFSTDLCALNQKCVLCGSTSWVLAASSYMHLASRDLWLHDKNVLLPNQTQPDKEEQTFSELHLIMLKTFLLDDKVSHFDSSHIDVFLMNKSRQSFLTKSCRQSLLNSRIKRTTGKL